MQNLYYAILKTDLEFNDSGICHGCLAYKNREKIDWNEKRKSLLKLLKNIKIKILMIV